jgi:hypothetical protein
MRSSTPMPAPWGTCHGAKRSTSTRRIARFPSRTRDRLEPDDPISAVVVESRSPYNDPVRGTSQVPTRRVDGDHARGLDSPVPERRRKRAVSNPSVGRGGDCRSRQGVNDLPRSRKSRRRPPQDFGAEDAGASRKASPVARVRRPDTAPDEPAVLDRQPGGPGQPVQRDPPDHGQDLHREPGGVRTVVLGVPADLLYPASGVGPSDLAVGLGSMPRISDYGADIRILCGSQSVHRAKYRRESA